MEHKEVKDFNDNVGVDNEPGASEPLDPGSEEEPPQEEGCPQQQKRETHCQAYAEMELLGSLEHATMSRVHYGEIQCAYMKHGHEIITMCVQLRFHCDAARESVHKC